MKLTLLKNPIVLGILAGVLTYLYFYWDAKKKKERALEMNQEIKEQPVSLITPALVAVIVWFTAASYFDQDDQDDTNKSESSNNSSKSETKSEAKNKSGGSSSSTTSKKSQNFSIKDTGSYHYIGKNKVRLPPTDVFLDIAKF